MISSIFKGISCFFINTCQSFNYAVCSCFFFDVFTFPICEASEKGFYDFIHFERKSRAPIITEAIEAINTEAAATSFAIFASGLISGLTIFTIDSREVLISSRIKTDAIVITKIAHSIGENLSIKADIRAVRPKNI